MSIIISQAHVDDTNEIMQFINDVWREGHILSKNKNFFLYEFKNNNNLNIIIAKENNKLVGFLGYYYYNNKNNPDMAGSMWKIHPDVQDLLLGVKIRNYFIKNISQNFFSTPGPGIHMKPVYKILRMSWQRMEQFYIVNQQINEYKLLLNPIINEFKEIYNKNIMIKKAKTILDIKHYIFDENVQPLKDFSYIKKRYFEHPIYTYNVYYLEFDNAISNIFVCRKSTVENNSAYRIVDFFGELTFIKEISTFLHDYIQKNNIEYLDFVNSGYSKKELLQAGFTLLDLDQNLTIVPNFFEPFVQKNVPIYCVADKSDKTIRQHKADGDQDRPSN